MQELQEIYERITFLRQKGVKMKEMAEQANISPSVLSAIYSTVLPGYLKNIEKGENDNEALDNALVWVNNVSKKMLLGSLPHLKSALYSMDLSSKSSWNNQSNPFLTMIEHSMKNAVGRINSLSGIYWSYSRSSANQSLKIEPYLIAPAENGCYVEVGHINSSGVSHWGVAVMNGINHLYLTFNESQSPQLALYNICLKIPMHDNLPFLRGLYTCLDYNYNPVARRILLVKESDSIARQDFLQLKGKMKTYEMLDAKEQAYYHYTCHQEDIIRMCNIPMYQMTEEDLKMEKRVLSVYQDSLSSPDEGDKRESLE